MFQVGSTSTDNYLHMTFNQGLHVLNNLFECSLYLGTSTLAGEAKQKCYAETVVSKK